MFDSTVWEILLGSIPTPVLLYSGWASKSNYISILPKIIGDQQMILCVLSHLKIGIKIFNLFCTFNMCHCVTIFTRSDCTIVHFQILLNRENNVFLKIFDILVEFLPYLKKKSWKNSLNAKMMFSESPIFEDCKAFIKASWGPSINDVTHLGEGDLPKGNVTL